MLFQEERFGMFVHWGIYSVNGWHEQEQWRRNVPKAEYVKLAERFNPAEFDVREWLELMKEAGMEYLCFTTKHHDGFCMWDTEYTDYNIMNTPYGKDILKQIAEGCAQYGIKLALYYSCPDWHYKHSVNFGGDHQLRQPNPGDEPDETLYKEYIRNQITELLTGYGKIEALFWDIPPYNQDESINQYVRSLQPDILINDRGYSKGDYSTPERSVPAGERFPMLTEACQSVSAESWGYRREDDFYSNIFLMESIDKIMSRGGNYLLNVGPDAQGHIHPEAAEKVRTIGRWYQAVKESYLQAEWVKCPELPYRMTLRDNYLYIHLDGIPVAGGLGLKPINILPKEAIVLNTGEKVIARVEYLPSDFVENIENPVQEYLHLHKIPVDRLAGELIVLRLEFEEIDLVRAKLKQ